MDDLLEPNPREVVDGDLEIQLAGAEVDFGESKAIEVLVQMLPFRMPSCGPLS